MEVPIFGRTTGICRPSYVAMGDTKPLKQRDVMGELRLRLKKAFDEAGIEIRWPHTKVYFGNVPPTSLLKEEG